MTTFGSVSDTSGTTKTNEDYELRMKAVDALMDVFQHDPLCPGWFETYDDQLECPTCDLIAKVRADERNKQEVTRVDV